MTSFEAIALLQVNMEPRKLAFLDSLPEFLDLKLVGKTILVVNKQVGPLLANPLGK